MENRDIDKQYKAIKKLIDNTQISTHGDLELQGHWGRYLCILVSGFLENAISAVYIDFVSESASPAVIKYATNIINKINNPKSNRFVETAKQFKVEWGEELEIFFRNNDNYKTAIDNIMTNRHLIAHGKNSSISVHNVSLYFYDSVEVIKFIEKQCKNRAR
ncbi:HEPN domain-containing protein [Shewanella oncorhynchi]|uniref:HEPN domain-containing protein n=1 Tax=Shewanella oncorhynchi TaxID=2726434 RepID=UPI003D7BFAA6